MSSCTKEMGAGSETSEEKGSNSQEYEKSKGSVNKMLDGHTETRAPCHFGSLVTPLPAYPAAFTV